MGSFWTDLVKSHFDKPVATYSDAGIAVLKGMKATKRPADNIGDFLDDMDPSKDDAVDSSSDADFIKHIAVAAMMDVAGVDFKALQTGLSVVTVPSDAAIDVYAALQRIVIDIAFAGNVSRTAGVKRNKKIDGSSDTVGILMSGTDSDDADLALFWQAGYSAIVGLGFGHNLPPATKKLADRHYQLPGLSAFVIGLTIFAVTGSKAPVDPDVCAQADMSLLLLSIRRGMTADLCVDRLKRIQAAPGIPNADADAPVDLPMTVSIGAAAKDVVTKLSAMTGFGDAKAWGMQLASDLRDFSAGVLTWDDVDKGILLSGPPGCGKTTFARALGAECGVDIVVSTYADWGAAAGSGDYVTRGLAKLFKDWRKKAKDGPFILFLDEFDSMGARGENGNNDGYWTAIINTWLAFLDGADPRDGIIAIAATNFPDRIDPALRRPGRLDRHVTIPMPTIKDLPGIVRHHLGIDDVRAAKACRGMSPADIQQACRDARRTARKLRRNVAADDLIALIDAKRDRSDDWLKAVHESGHVIAHRAVGKPFHYVDLDAAAVCTPKVKHGSIGDLTDEIVMALGGRAAEDVVLDRISSGCADDLRQATAVAQMIHATSGLGESGLVHGVQGDIRLENACRKTIEDAYAKAVDIMRTHYDDLVRLAYALVDQRYFDAKEVDTLLAELNAPATLEELNDFRVPEDRR